MPRASAHHVTQIFWYDKMIVAANVKKVKLVGVVGIDIFPLVLREIVEN